MKNEKLTPGPMTDLQIIENELGDAMALLLELSVSRAEQPRLTTARRLLLNALARAKRLTSGVPA